VALWVAGGLFGYFVVRDRMYPSAYAGFGAIAGSLIGTFCVHVLGVASDDDPVNGATS
jgi:hypothetical protein